MNSKVPKFGIPTRVLAIVAGTGHRPDKLGGYGRDVNRRLVALAKRELEALSPMLVISGMALGWDQALAEAAIQMGIPLHAYIPFVGQESRWPYESQVLYRNMLSCARLVLDVSNGGPYSRLAMDARNRRMVDDSTMLLALWNGSPGGTGNCVKYAMRANRDIVNCWSRYGE